MNRTLERNQPAGEPLRDGTGPSVGGRWPLGSLLGLFPPRFPENPPPVLGDAYQTPPGRGRFPLTVAPQPFFLAFVIRTAILAGIDARRGRYTEERWEADSWATLRAAEACGARVRIEGLRHVRALGRPAIFIGNHMSTLETWALASLVNPIQPVTFVAKQSLLKYPFFGDVMRWNRSLAVTRSNPREDFNIVMNEGTRHLNGEGISIILFPQTTRTRHFIASEMSSIGVKLARRSGAPVVPLALKTDFWGNGALARDLGEIDPGRTIRFEFGSPLEVTGNGSRQQAEVATFIRQRLERWKASERPRLG